MSGQQFTAWQLYELVEPFGERAHYWRTGQLCAAMFNSQRTKKSDRVAKAEDYMPNTFSNEPDEDQPPVDEFTALKARHEQFLGSRRGQ